MSAWPRNTLPAILGAEYYLPVGVHDAIASDFDADGRFPISDRRRRPLILVGRLKPGVTRAQADAQLKVIAAAHEQAYPDDNKNQDLVVGTLDRLDISTRPQDGMQIWRSDRRVRRRSRSVLPSAARGRESCANCSCRA